MGAQDKTEQVLRDFHILFSQSEVYDKSTNRVIVDKSAALQLLQKLNVCIYELMEEHEMTEQSRAAAEREWRKKNNEIVQDAGRLAEDVYAGSVMYTDEALRRVQDIMEEAISSVKQVYEKMDRELQKEKATVHQDQMELRSHLEDLRDTDKYMNLIEERNKQIDKERAKAKDEVEQPSPYASIKPEIKINAEYFEKAGISMIEDVPEEIPEEKLEPVTAEVKVNLDAEYFKWKEDASEGETIDKKSEKSSLFGKIRKGEK